MLLLEGAEADESDFLAGGNRIDNSVDGTVNSSGSLLLGQVGVCGNFFDEFSFSHDLLFLSVLNLC